jgi:hypothetical protein
MLKPLDITQTTFDALSTPPPSSTKPSNEAVYEAVSEAVSDVISEADASQFHELSRKIN